MWINNGMGIGDPSKFHFTYIHYLCMSVNANYKSAQNERGALGQ